MTSRISDVRRRALISCFSLVLAGLAAAQDQPNTPQAQPPTPNEAPRTGPESTTPRQQDRKPEDNATAPPEAGAPVDSKEYKVGPEDVLYVRVWHESEFTGPVVVHSDGKITLPLVGDLQAGGLTPVDIEKNVAKALTKYVQKPLVTVTVQQVLSRKYYMDGEIMRAGEYPLVAPTTILEAISKAGGLREFANGKKIYVLRGDQRIPFNYKDVTHGKHMDQNIPLKPGDHIFIP